MIGQKAYELSNHLGNVLVTVSDARMPVAGTGSMSAVVVSYNAMVVSATDYSAFGAPMPGRQYSSTSYRYGFNGKENDLETVGTGEGWQDYGMRIYNPSLGRFLSVDPLKARYAFYTPYAFAGNSPIACADLDGMEPVYVPDKHTGSGNVMIILLDSPTTMLNVYVQAQLVESSWDYVCVNSLEEGDAWLHKYYADGSVNNFVLMTHGTGTSASCDGNAICAKDATGDLEQNHSDKIPVTTQDFITAANGSTTPASSQPTVSPQPTISAPAKQPSNPTSEEGVQNAKAIKSMSSTLAQNATVLFMGCGLGRFEDLDQAVYNTMNGNQKHLTMYFNKGTTEFWYNTNNFPITQGPVLDEPLSDGMNNRQGWNKIGPCFLTRSGTLSEHVFDMQVNTSEGELIQEIPDPAVAPK